MSLAGIRSTQGDEYQLRVGLHWLIRLLTDETISGIQAESVGLPGEDGKVTVDDIVILYQDSRACFIQAKKNQPQHSSWSFSDKKLRAELLKARDQLESRKNSEVCFYSRSPFGELKALVEDCKKYPDLSALLRDAPRTISESLKRLGGILERSEEETYSLACKIRFGPTFEFEDWDRQNREDLNRIVPRVDLALPLLERFLESHQSKLRDAKHIITRTDLVAELERHGLYLSLKRAGTEILGTFSKASRIGRVWLRTVGGEKIPRIELSRLIELIEQGKKTILLTDRPGGGKTCLLLDLADYIEQSTSWGFLFIKGDQFSDARSESDLAAKGLPQDIVGQCARLAESRRVVVILDSLDVLSLSRRHGALQVFLGLVDRLERIQGVTVIVACREFDLRYDPLLRDRKWEHSVTLEALDFERVVTPFLRKWGVEPESLNLELKALLQIPQNLHLFEKLAGLGDTSRLLSAHDLYERFLDEVVRNDPQLGGQALHALQNMAERLMQQRAQTSPRVAFGVDESIIQRLISQEILIEPSASSLAFSHQTLADSLIVRGALAQNLTFADFILDHPPLPFIRPAVRAFFFHLRAHQPDLFRRQLWTVLSSDKIAYHLKRLVSESLAEVTPTEEDWPLVRRLFQHHPDLFRRFLWRADSDAWFGMFTQYWLSEAKASQDRENWLLQFVGRLRVWVNRHPAKTVALWREALSAQWSDAQRLGWEISLALNQFEAWDTDGMRELLEALIENAGTDRDFLGRSISRWVQATNSGDNLLWRYITKRVSVEGLAHRSFRKELRCAPHDFHDRNFFAERLCQSDELLTLVVNDLENWSHDSIAYYGGNHLRSTFLHSSSWERRHGQHDMHFVDGQTVLLDGLETTLKRRAKTDDAWWRNNEPHLRTSQEVTIHYFLIQAYKENVEANIAGIETQLTDQTLFRYGQLEYELGELMQAAYSFLSDSALEANQSMILSLYEDKEQEPEEHRIWYFQKIHEYLLWIPSFFYTQETQSFVDFWRSRFGDALPQPYIWSSGGSVKAPLGTKALVDLPDETLFRLLSHYNTYSGRSETIEGRLVGGRGALHSVLLEAASLHPRRFFALLYLVLKKNLHPDYVHALIDGIANHLRYRFGNLRPANANEWKPVEPLPEGKNLAAALLELLERQPIIWKNEWTFSHALKACCEVLDDPESTERLTFLLLLLLRSKNPESQQDVKDGDALLSQALNSIRGVVADSAMTLCNRLLEKEQTLPELLSPLLVRCARDPARSVRVSILQQLPYLMHQQPDLGWRLFDHIFQEPQSHLWTHAERCLYYQYRNHFEKVKPYLDRLFQEGLGEAGDTWSRITALACLAEHIDKEQLYIFLKTTNAKVRKGAAEVFSANLNQHEHATICHEGLLSILQQKELTEDIIWTVEKCFDKDSATDLIPDELAFAFVDALFTEEKLHGTYPFLEWLPFKARRDPVSALQLTEALADKLEQQDQPQGFWHTEPLVATLVEILREADETDDAAMIQRAIQLQDRFLKMELHDMETLLDGATRN